MPPRLIDQLDELMHIAYVHMSTSPSSSESWRRLYTDACLLRSLAFHHPPSRSVALQSIATLDRAIVFAGAPGDGRLDLILQSILHIQQTYLPPCPFQSASLSDIAISPLLPRQLHSSLHDIPRINPPSFDSFQKTASRHPFILPGYVRNWPAMQEHPWASTGYLHSIAGPGRLVPIEVGCDYRKDDWTQKMMSWSSFLTNLDSSAHNERDVLYLAQHDLMKQFPALKADILVPDYIYVPLESPADFPGYKPPGNDEQLVFNAWLGPGGTVSPAHTDPFFNFYAQVVGRKTVWLAPPSMTPFMYPYPPVTTNKSQTHNPAANSINPSMSNTSQVDVFASSANEQGQPLFWEKVVPNAIRATLEPGDLLFFPPGWWHAFRSEEKSFSVSMWF